MISFIVPARRVAVVMVSSVIALCTASAQQREQKPTTIADLRNAIESVLHETRTPGAGIAIVSRDSFIVPAHNEEACGVRCVSVIRS